MHQQQFAVVAHRRVSAAADLWVVARRHVRRIAIEGLRVAKLAIRADEASVRKSAGFDEALVDELRPALARHDFSDRTRQLPGAAAIAELLPRSDGLGFVLEYQSPTLFDCGRWVMNAGVIRRGPPLDARHHRQEVFDGNARVMVAPIEVFRDRAIKLQQAIVHQRQDHPGSQHFGGGRDQADSVAPELPVGLLVDLPLILAHDGEGEAR